MEQKIEELQSSLSNLKLLRHINIIEYEKDGDTDLFSYGAVSAYENAIELINIFLKK